MGAISAGVIALGVIAPGVIAMGAGDAIVTVVS
jgi:hypothetical protein